MKLPYRLFPVGIALTLAGAVNGATFDEIVNKAVMNSPALQASNAEMVSELEALKAENTLSNPGIDFERLWNSGEGEGNKWSIGVTQEFAWPGTYSARRKNIKSLKQAQQARRESELIAERLKAGQLIVEIIAANKEISVLTEINESMKRLQVQYMHAWSQGETTILDVNKIKIEAVRSSNALDAAYNRMRTLSSELQAMTGNASELLTVPADLDFPHMVLQDVSEYIGAISSNPEIESLAHTVTAADNAVSVAKAERIPSLALSYKHVYEGGSHFNGLGVGVSLPVWSQNRAVRSAEAAKLAAKFNLASRAVAIETQLKADFNNASALNAQMRGFGPVVEGVNNLNLLQKALEGGELNLLSYIQEVNYFLQARLDYISISKEYTLLTLKLNSLLPQSSF